MELISRQAAINALERIFNFCEEIDAHLPEDEKSGYKMFPDYATVRTFLTQLPSAEKHGNGEIDKRWERSETVNAERSEDE